MRCVGLILGFFWGSSALLMAQGLTPPQLIERDRLEWRTITWQTGPMASASLRAIQRAIEGRTSLIMAPEQQWVAYEPEKLRQYPFLHWEMCGQPPPLTLQAQWAWRDFFNAGGTLYLDQCPLGETRMTPTWKDWSQRIYPETRWRELSNRDTLSFSFYLLEKRMLLTRGQSVVLLLENDGRAIMIMNQSPELSWERLKQSSISVTINPPATEWRVRFYTNLMMYLLTGHYKSDQLHAPTILLRRK